ncbi:MAG: hypothetical protein WB680_16245 [Candidatus Acidiferrales bacterium]
MIFAASIKDVPHLPSNLPLEGSQDKPALELFEPNTQRLRAGLTSAAPTVLIPADNPVLALVSPIGNWQSLGEN